MKLTFEKLLERAKNYQMTEEEKEKQRISFAFGNASISNPNITREMVIEEARKLRQAH